MLSEDIMANRKFKNRARTNEEHQKEQLSPTRLQGKIFMTVTIMSIAHTPGKDATVRPNRERWILEPTARLPGSLGYPDTSPFHSQPKG
jgi:hypothetical protein